ncbi:delta-class carbonic anhydrase [Marinomonas ostreistagni]|uniref:delta-class carbonic anhydrase n=1 Tax=Marinomonas ostreistagni TaxID=359209 RepID=UPI00194E2CB2|nr:delta-class carbonic anhydrase [Marinomonas ostreistagni]MBM6551825.1 hypothetical protein [Marinomonas ostreistagni]
MKHDTPFKAGAWIATLLLGSSAMAAGQSVVADEVIAKQRAALAISTQGTGMGPQSPRDIDSKAGQNTVVFSQAPAATEMNLCNIHLHKNAEHKGGEFTTYAGNGDGHGYNTGYKYSGQLSAAERQPLAAAVCDNGHSAVQSGDTIEVHYVYSTAQVQPGVTLGACVKNPILNPQLRVEGQVMVAVNDPEAADFTELTRFEIRNHRTQATQIPADTGTPVQYAGSTTGPSFNEKGSPYQVTWSVRPQVKKVNIASLGKWCQSNVFEEDHAHGVRNLITNPDLLSPIQ